MAHSPVSRLVVIAAAMAAAACGSSGDAEHLFDPAAAREAVALNNRGVELLRQGVREQVGGGVDAAQESFRAALACFDDAIRLAGEDDGHGYAKAWANKSYALWRMERLDESAAAAAETRRIEPSYVFNPRFVDAMAAAGRPIVWPSGR